MNRGQEVRSFAEDRQFQWIVPGSFEEIVKHVLAHAIGEARRDDVGDEFLLVLRSIRCFGEQHDGSAYGETEFGNGFLGSVMILEVRMRTATTKFIVGKWHIVLRKSI